MAGPTTHHCPGDSNGGNCNHRSKMPDKRPYCDVHQKWCLVCLANEKVYVKHMKTEPCPNCRTIKKLQQQRKDQEERGRKDKEIGDKIAKDKAEKAKKARGRR